MPLDKEAGLGPGHIVLDGDPAPHSSPSPFRPMPIVAKRSPISATAELLFGFSFFIILFCSVPCGRLSWLIVSFWAHVNIANRIVSYRKMHGINRSVASHFLQRYYRRVSMA